MWLDRLGFYGMPAGATVLLHLALVLFLTLRWSPENTVVAAAPEPRIIQAALVDAETLRPKKKPAAKPRTTQPTPARKKPQPTTPTPRETTPKPAPVQPQPVVTQPKPQPEPEPEVDQGDQLREEILADLGSQPDLPGSVDAPSARDTAVALIQRAVMNRWTRPPSARNGMVAILMIQLVPTGEVVGVSVLESSGNAAFDRSAMTAVERVGRFPEVTQLEREVFERDFRRFQLKFRPEDLRY
jgi:colicin import membrane protein